jgi:hypothetical protein
VAKFVATNYNIKIGGTDFSSSIAAVTLDISAEEQETTAFSGTGWRTRIAGLKDASVSLDFHQDFGAAAVDATLWPLLGGTVSVEIAPAGSAITSTNPAYEFTALVTEYQPFASSVGDLATLSVSWPVVGEVTRATA